MKIWKNAVLFYIGGLAYMGLEVLWRGYSHGSMFLAGGLCFLLVGALSRSLSGLSRPVRACAGALVITMVELGTGLLVNRNYTVWDYRRQPGNFLGQICPAFTLLWIPVALMAIYLFDALNGRLEQKLSPG